jgi:hypothetical protein
MVLAICFVIQQVEVMFVFLQRQQHGDGLTPRANHIPRSVFSQGTGEVILGLFAHHSPSPSEQQQLGQTEDNAGRSIVLRPMQKRK